MVDAVFEDLKLEGKLPAATATGSSEGFDPTQLISMGMRLGELKATHRTERQQTSVSQLQALRAVCS